MMRHYSSPNTNDGALFHPLTPTIPPTDTNGETIPPTPMMGHDSSH
ncbi:unnamed protein product [Staurois parvus]|uniref:Uncharacterized protein n=1 Tax=Staurois parvus TaxID=386267 RepID=A0ABN9D120_9NEOB|nr:unnamed protein product [Staurois parvus]